MEVTKFWLVSKKFFKLEKFQIFFSNKSNWEKLIQKFFIKKFSSKFFNKNLFFIFFKVLSLILKVDANDVLPLARDFQKDVTVLNLIIQ